MREPKNQSKSYRKAMAISRRLAKKPTPGGVKAWADAMRATIGAAE